MFFYTTVLLHFLHWLPVAASLSYKILMLAINIAFQIFYGQLYTSVKDPNPCDTEIFLNSINLPKLTSQEVEALHKLHRHCPAKLEELV